MIKPLIWVFIGGGVGSMLRFLMGTACRNLNLTFPLGTFLSNMTGCFLIGFFYGLIASHGILKPEIRLLLITGLCGGFTTFSSFAYESIDLLKRGDILTFGLYSGGTMVLGFLITFIGYYIVQQF